MIDHTGVSVSDFAASKAFLEQALAPIGDARPMAFGAGITGSPSVAGFGEAPGPDLRIAEGPPDHPDDDGVFVHDPEARP